MRDPGQAELASALAQFCDEVLSDFTFPTREGLRGGGDADKPGSVSPWR